MAEATGCSDSTEEEVTIVLPAGSVITGADVCNHMIAWFDSRPPEFWKNKKNRTNRDTAKAFLFHLRSYLRKAQ